MVGLVLQEKAVHPRMVRAFMLRGFWDELGRRGVSLSELERLSGVCRPRADDYSTLIPATAMHRLFAVSQTLARDEFVGLTAGRAIGISAFHLVSHLVLASATLREAVELVARVQAQVAQRLLGLERLSDGGMRLGLALHDVDANLPGVRAESELTGVLLHDVAMRFLAEDARPSVEFPFKAPRDTALHQRMFPGGVRFGCEGTFVRFSRAALRRRSGADATLLHALLRLALDQYAAAEASDAWICRVRSVLRAQRAPRLLDASSLAHQLGVSVRSLERRLAREGSSFTALLDEALFERAQALLQRPGATTVQVADALGYAEVSSFFRAFRRLSGGFSPVAYRRLAKTASS